MVFFGNTTYKFNLFAAFYKGISIGGRTLYTQTSGAVSKPQCRKSTRRTAPQTFRSPVHMQARRILLVVPVMVVFLLLKQQRFVPCESRR